MRAPRAVVVGVTWVFATGSFGCATQLETRRTPVSAQALRGAVDGVDASPLGKTNVHDVDGHSYPVDPTTRVTITAPGRPAPDETTLGKLVAACSVPSTRMTSACPLADPKASYVLEYQKATKVFDLSAIPTGAAIDLVLLGLVVPAEVGCFAGWCSSDGKHAVLVGDGIAAGVVATFLLLGFALKAAVGPYGD